MIVSPLTRWCEQHLTKDLYEERILNQSTIVFILPWLRVPWPNWPMNKDSLFRHKSPNYQHRVHEIPAALVVVGQECSCLKVTCRAFSWFSWMICPLIIHDLLRDFVPSWSPMMRFLTSLCPLSRISSWKCLLKRLRCSMPKIASSRHDACVQIWSCDHDRAGSKLTIWGVNHYRTQSPAGVASKCQKMSYWFSGD